MTRKKKFKIKQRSSSQILFLSSAIDDQSWREEMTKENKRAEFILSKLKKMKIMEIVVKIVAVSWAFIWTGASLITLLYRDSLWMIIFTALPAIGFWIILARSAGSIGTINMEIRELKKELMANKKK